MIELNSRRSAAPHGTRPRHPTLPTREEPRYACLGPLCDYKTAGVVVKPNAAARIAARHLMLCLEPGRLATWQTRGMLDRTTVPPPTLIRRRPECELGGEDGEGRELEDE